MQRDDAKAWSMIDPRPGFYYHPRSDTHLCYWQGVAMVRSHALMIVAGAWEMMYLNDRMRNAAYDEFKRACRLGAFGNVDWLSYSEGAYGYHARLVRWLTKRNPNLLTQLRDDYTIKHALEWFRSDNEQVLDD